MRDKWLQQLENFKSVTNHEKPLEGAIVWLGRALDEGAASLANEIAEFLTDVGAKVESSFSGPRGLICGPDLARIENADVVLMLAETPGVTAEALDFCQTGPWQRPIKPRMHVVLPDEHRAGYMYARLQELGAANELYTPEAIDEGKVAVNSVCRAIAIHRKEQLDEKEAAAPKPTIGIVTALQLEFDAVKHAMPNGRRVRMRGDGLGLRTYVHLTVPSDEGGEHQVVVVNGGMSNNKAVAAAKQLMNDYATVQDVIMVGIAGGVPNLKNAKEDVHLGDVVVSSGKGVIKYDMKKVTSDGETRNHEPRPPSHDWLHAATDLAGDVEALAATWLDLDKSCAEAKTARPTTDELLDEPEEKDRTPAVRPTDPTRIAGRPQVRFGVIGSADTVVKSAEMRDGYANELNIMAFEMEGSGIAEVMWQGTKGYLVIRGICDYCNDAKNKEWQPYAAAAAAAFARHLIASMPVIAPKV